MAALRDFTHQRTVLLESSHVTRLCRPSVIEASPSGEVKLSCVVKPKGRITVVRVVNNSSCPTTIAKGITVEIFHTTPELEQNENEGEAQITDSQLHLPDLALDLENADIGSEQKSKLSQKLSENSLIRLQ